MRLGITHRLRSDHRQLSQVNCCNQRLPSELGPGTFGQLQPKDTALVTERLIAGTEYHQTCFKNVRYVSAARRATRKFVILSLFLLVIVLFVLFFGQVHGAPRTVRSGAGSHGIKGQTASAQVGRPQDNPIKAQLLLRIAAVAASVIAFLLRLLGRRREQRWQMPPGQAISLDGGNARTLVCNVLGLVGEPDVVRRERQFFVSEERKSRIQCT